MSNSIYITPKEFKDPYSDKKTYGVLVSDIEAADYIDWWSELPLSLRDVLKQVIRDAGSVIGDILDFAQEDDRGLFVAGEWFSPEEIRKCFDEVEEELSYEDQ